MTFKVVQGNVKEGIPISKAIIAGDYIFVSGEVAFDDTGEIVKGGIEAETRQVLDSISNTLKNANSSLEEIVKTTVWLKNVIDFNQFNKIYAEYFPGKKPTRSTVRADLMVDAKIEIEVIAYSPKI